MSICEALSSSAWISSSEATGPSASAARARRRRGAAGRLLYDDRRALLGLQARADVGDLSLDRLTILRVGLEVALEVVEGLLVAASLDLRAPDVEEHVGMRKDPVRFFELRDAFVDLAFADEAHAATEVVTRLGTNVGANDAHRWWSDE
jgi:hypothetical protein